ncbi:Synaptotagmin-4, partial [Diplonema papillatum]
MAQRIFDLFRVHALGFGARRVMLWVVGSTATMGGGALLESMDDDTARRRRQGALVVPLPAAEGFKDPLLEDLLDEADTIAGRSAMPSSVLANEHPVQWLNESITPIWPFLDAGIRDFVVTKLQPAIQNAIPVVGKQIRFTEITLGHVPPQLGPVTTHLTDDGTNLELFVQVNYEGELALDLDAALATVRIGDLQIKGELMLAFKPLVDAINPIGGMEITCLDQPSIKLKLQAKGMFLDSVPNFYKLLQRTVDRVIADVLVMPNNIAFEIPTVSAGHAPVPKLVRIPREAQLAVGGQLAKVMRTAATGSAAGWLHLFAFPSL